MTGKKITKSITLYEDQIFTIQCMADDLCEGDFGRAMRSIVDLWVVSYADKVNKK